MPVSTLPLAGYNTSGQINTVAVALTEWEVTPAVDDTDATNTLSGGYHVPFGGPVKCEITLTGFYDASQNPFEIAGSPGDLLGLMAGNFVGLTIYVNDAIGVGATSYWQFPAGGGLPQANQLNGCLVKSCQIKTSVKDKVMFTARLVGSGQFAFPTAVA